MPSRFNIPAPPYMRSTYGVTEKVNYSDVLNRLSKLVGCSGIKDRVRLKSDGTLRPRPMGIE